jgi:dipeptidyl aminopeptidase/acylaminoacyl peptidase
MTPVPLIPRRTLFSNPDRALVQISPEGSRLSWLAPVEGVLNVWVAPQGAIDAAQPITHDTGRGIYQYFWAFTAQHILFLQDNKGDENWRLHSVDVLTGATRDLTPFEGVQARVLHMSHRRPGEIVIGVNNRSPQWHDVYRINITTGSMTLLEQNDRFNQFLLDDNYQLLMAGQPSDDGGMRLFRRTREGGWEPWDWIPSADAMTSGPFGVDDSGKKIYLVDSRGRDTAAVVSCTLEDKQTVVLAEDPRVDAERVLVHPTSREVQAVSFTYERRRWQFLDAAMERDFDYLKTVAKGEIDIAGTTLDDRFWVVRYFTDDGPFRFHLYDRERRQERFLFTHRKSLEPLTLAKMCPAVIRSRDGLDLVAYYSLPAGSDSDGDGIPDEPLPAVLIPHGGPWGRDYWGYDPWHQWLANRGYAVVCVNFRSSTTFGKAFVNAGDKEWGGKIREDQVDAVEWAVSRRIADPGRVGIMGASFGGYSALAGLTFTPEQFACGVDLVGPSDLVSFLETIPPYWLPDLSMFTNRVGDHRTEEGRALLRRHSPLTYVDRICRPLLIGHGENDPRIKKAESDQIVAAMARKKIPVTYVLYPDEGHGFARPENNLSFNAIAEAFLAKHLGGSCQPIGNDLKGSSLIVVTGAEQIPGLQDALAAGETTVRTS